MECRYIPTPNDVLITGFHCMFLINSNQFVNHSTYCCRVACGPTRPAASLPTFLIGPRAEYNSLRARGPEILAELPAMTTETMFLIVTRYQLRNTYVNGTLLVSTYLCLQRLTPKKGFPKCLYIVSNLQSEPKIFMRASCGPR